MAIAPHPAPVLLERDAELGAVAALVDAARSHAGRLLAFEGRAGMGKSRLLGATRERAEAAGLRVVAARAGELETEFAFGVVRQLFEPVLATAEPAEREALLAGAAALAAPLFGDAAGAAAAPAGAASFPTLHGLYWLVANLSAQRPLLLSIDDLHWCDAPSLRWLAFLSRRLEGLALLVAVALRPPRQAHEAPLLAELEADPEALVVRPGPLGPASIRRLAADALGAEADDGFAQACLAATGGNPLFVRALLDALRTEGVVPRAAEAGRVAELGPSAVSRALELRLLRLSPAAGALIRAIAVLGDGTPLPRAAALAELEPAAAADAVTELVAADLLRSQVPLEVVHPVVRTAVHEAMGAAASVAHRRAAGLVLDAGGRPEQAAAHLLPTEPAGDAFVVAALQDAAERALGDGAPDAAVRYLARALEEPPAPERRVDLLTRLGMAELHVDERAAVGHLRAAMEATGDPVTRAERALAYGQALIYVGRHGDAGPLLVQALDELGDGRPDLAEQLEGQLQIAGWCEPALAAMAQGRRLELRESDLGPGVGGANLRAMLAFAAAREARDREWAVGLARRALAADLDSTGATLLIDYAIWTLVLAGELDAAEGVTQRLLAQARHRGDRLTVNDQRILLGAVHLARGELRDAEDQLTEDGPLVVVMRAYARGFLAPALLDAGRPDEAAALIDSADIDGLPSGHALVFSHGAARVQAERLPPEAAADGFLAVGAVAAPVGAVNPAIVPWRSDAALVLARAGRRAEAVDLAREEVRLAGRWGAARPLGVALRALGLVEGGARGLDRLHEAVGVLAASEARLEHARALLSLGAALRRGNARSDARALLREAVALAHACGAERLVAEANDELAASGAQRRTLIVGGPESLTASERRVARLAADGLANKEIAQTLFVTVKTVEIHLSRAYRKLDIGSRSELARALG